MESGDYVGEEKQAKPVPDADHGDGGVDLISNLPNDVLVCILRLVGDARQVVRTSALARRWRGLWAHVPALRFDFEPEFQSPSDVERFIAFVNNVLAEHAQPAGSVMEQMRVFLKLHYERGEPHLAAATVFHAAEGWIRYAVQHELTSFTFVLHAMPKKRPDIFNQEEDNDDQGEVVEEEEDNDSGSEGNDQEEEEEEEDEDEYEEDEDGHEEDEEDDDYEEEGKYSGDEEDDKEIPLIELLISSGKLKTMRLSPTPLEGIGGRLPSTSGIFTSLAEIFTSLTELVLEYLEINRGGLLGRLLSPARCPRLQKLLMRAVKFKHTSTKKLVLETSTLLELTMCNMGEMESLELTTPNLRSFELKYCYKLRWLRMSASRLEQLTFSHNSTTHNSYVARSYLDVPCMVRLRIRLVSHNYCNINEASLSLLESCTPATCLLVDLHAPKWERGYDILTSEIPQHPNVTSLVVNIHTMRDRHFFGDGVVGLLTRFNNLRYLCLQLDEVPGCIKKDKYFSKDADGNLPFVCNHEDRWIFSEISLSKLIRAEFGGLTGTICELRFLRFLLQSATDLEKVIVRFSVNTYNIKDWVDFFLNMVLEDGVWAANEDHSYEWRP